MYVAADARAAVAMVQQQCGDAHVVALPPRLGATRAHTEVRSYARGVDHAAAQSSSVLDWLMLMHAREVYRIGAQHSSYVTAAVMAGCRVRQGHAPRHWRFKSAASWLLGKVDTALRAARKRAPADGGADELYCNSSIARLINGTPCATPCLVSCRSAIYQAYA